MQFLERDDTNVALEEGMAAGVLELLEGDHGL